MEAVVLAAGEGTRLRPLTAHRPKVMLRVGNRPILEFVVSALAGANVRDIVLVVGYRREQVMGHFEDGSRWGVKIRYVVQDKQLGTAHALAQAIPTLTGSGDILVLPGDNVIDAATLGGIQKLAGYGLVTTESATPAKYGVILTEGGRLQKIVEKPEIRLSTQVSTGIVRLPRDAMRHVEAVLTEGRHDLTSLLQRILQTGATIATVRSGGRWADAVYPWDLVRLNAEALAGGDGSIGGIVESGAVLRGPVTIGEGSVVRSGSYVQGPVVIGKGCDIGPHAVLMPSTSIGNNVRVGPFTEIRESIIMNDSAVGSFSRILHSVIGEGADLGSHLSVSAGDARVILDDEVHRVPAMGAIIGDDCRLGDLVVIAPGVIVGSSARIASLRSLTANVPAGCTIV